MVLPSTVCTSLVSILILTFLLIIENSCPGRSIAGYTRRWIRLATSYLRNEQNVKSILILMKYKTVDGSTIMVIPAQFSNQVIPSSLTTSAVMIDRPSNKQPGNLYVKENNYTKRIGNPNYIYGVPILNLAFETYNPLNNLNIWIAGSIFSYWSFCHALVSKNVRV